MASPTLTSIAAKTKPIRSPQSLMHSAVNVPVSQAAAEAPPNRRHAAKVAVSVNGEASDSSVGTRAKASALMAEHTRPMLTTRRAPNTSSARGTSGPTRTVPRGKEEKITPMACGPTAMPAGEVGRKGAGTPSARNWTKKTARLPQRSMRRLGPRATTSSPSSSRGSSSIARCGASGARASGGRSVRRPSRAIGRRRRVGQVLQGVLSVDAKCVTKLCKRVHGAS
eukprot:scaffold10019_cov54-Phaeocystis_antarctica.AAC.3